MKTLRTIHRTTKFAFQNFWRNIWLTLATILVFVLTLVTINILLSMNYMTDVAINSVENRIDVSVYFDEEASEEIIIGAKDYLLALSQVKNVEYVSADEAYIRFTEANKNKPDVLRALDTIETNPLGGSLIITAHDTADFDFILEVLDNPTFGKYITRKDFSDHKVVIERIQNVTENIKLFMYFLAAVFAFIASLIVLNSIRVSIYTHKEEIAIMRLVGADNGFIRLPFIIESIIMSLLATVLTIALVLPSAKAAEPALSTFFDGTEIGMHAYFVTNWLTIFGTQFLILSALAILASIIAIRRYLRV